MVAREARAVREKVVMAELRVEAMAEIEAAIGDLPATALIPLLTFIVECRDRRRVSALQVRKALERWRVLQRFAELKRETGLSVRRVIVHLVRESARVGSGAPLKVRTLQHWVHDWNKIGPDGLAAGPASLVDRHERGGRKRKQ